MSTPAQDETARGFSAMAAEYDALATGHPIVAWMRRRIMEIVESRLQPGASVLEINAGSGIDAAYLAAKGHRVLATDVAPGMLSAIEEKARAPGIDGRLTWARLSFDELSLAAGGPYDMVFSNLGGLNCTADLASVVRGLPHVLRPGGTIVWVIMPPFCPWELLQALRGHLGTAGRRLRKDGTLAHVAGDYVRTWYHSPGKVMRVLGPEYRVEELRSFCLFAPPSFFGFSRRGGRAVRLLMRMDDALGRLPPFNRCGDFYALVARYTPPS
jgi:ubiquinone/menaquinone biosynthesis C-methylase UbiE